MSYDGSGRFVINSTGQPVVYNTVIDETVFNALTADLATGLTTCLTKDGQSTPTANITMGGFKLTSVAAATTTGDALSYGRAANVTTLTATGALTYGGVTLTNNVTGTGKMVLDTSPTITSPALVTPTLGVAAATSINFGGTALSHYDEGTWTPVDSSGAGLSFTVAKATYARIGRVLHYVLKLTFPATADTSSATIGGLPVAAAALSSGLSPYLSDSGSAATFPVADVLAGTTTIQLLNLAGSLAMTNANMSGKILVICGTYFVS